MLWRDALQQQPKLWDIPLAHPPDRYVFNYRASYKIARTIRSVNQMLLRPSLVGHVLSFFEISTVINNVRFRG
jgi:hypothetical protein